MKDINFADLQINLNRFRLSYKFALEEMQTKVNILREEFHVIHEYNPIEHISTRLKSPESILKKVMKKEVKLSLDEMRENIRDIAGLRITCSFIEDIYKVSDLIQSQDDITVVDVKDYIKNPKPNGYQSLHLVVKVPIFLSDGVEFVYVEVQIRTIAMDFWASLEHKIYYKYNKNIPAHIQDGLKEAAMQAAMLDRKMEQINHEVNILKQQDEQPKDFMTPQDVYQLLKKLSQVEGKIEE
ncbi:GTP pyrophosphokinase family protein [Metabacillus iocasae]|uniref:GTP pyrophosphokinase n=1 Tax=Priestia iocasae TaxID=2291674 RepID=A0ABS2R0U3_9BACI|nr:putative GTP pyrophosphokinase [Metabacillus iocasae]